MHNMSQLVESPIILSDGLCIKEGPEGVLGEAGPGND